MPDQVRETGCRLFEALELGAREVGVAVGGGEVGHQADDLDRRCRQLGQAPPAHARFQLQMDAYALRNRVVRDGQVEIGVAGLGDLAARGWAHDEDANSWKLAAQRQGFRDGRDAQRERTLSQCHPCDVDGSVPVGVGLDDRPQLGAPERLAERTDVAPNGAEVDGDLRSMHTDGSFAPLLPRRRAPWAGLRSDRSRSARSPGEPRARPPCGPRQPRRRPVAARLPWQGTLRRCR